MASHSLSFQEQPHDRQPLAYASTNYFANPDLSASSHGSLSRASMTAAHSRPSSRQSDGLDPADDDPSYGTRRPAAASAAVAPALSSPADAQVAATAIAAAAAHQPIQPRPAQSIPISSLISPPEDANPARRQACISCRRKKVGCDLRRPDSTGPPCLRCQHEKQECVVPPPENSFENPSPQELPSIRDLACPHCSLVFLRDNDLRAHLRTQCQEKHYVCPTCQARFRRLNDLDRHLRIHTGERPHACDICGRRFSRATTLTRHRQGPDGCAGRRADLGKRRFDRPPAQPQEQQQQQQQQQQDEDEDAPMLPVTASSPPLPPGAAQPPS